MNEEPPVTEAELARVLELDAKATQGPIDVWTHETNGEVSYRLRAPAHRNMAWVAQYDDALALAEYRTITPRLARELAAAQTAVERLTKERDEARGILSQLNADFEKQSPMLRPPLAAQVDYIASVVSERDSLRTQLAEREEDRKDLDFLSGLTDNLELHQYEHPVEWGAVVKVRFEVRYPLDEYQAAPDLRAAIRAARAQPEDGK